MATTQASTSASTTPVDLPAVAADGTGHKFNNSGKTLLVIKNSHASATRTVTIAPVLATRPADSNFPSQAAPSVVGVIPALATWVFGPFPAAYNDSAGQVAIGFSSAADVTIQVIEPNIR